MNLAADIPVVPGAIDFATKRVLIERTFSPTCDMEADLRAVKDYFRQFTGRHPDKFTAE